MFWGGSKRMELKVSRDTHQNLVLFSFVRVCSAGKKCFMVVSETDLLNKTFVSWLQFFTAPLGYHMAIRTGILNMLLVPAETSSVSERKWGFYPARFWLAIGDLVGCVDFWKCFFGSSCHHKTKIFTVWLRVSCSSHFAAGSTNYGSHFVESILWWLFCGCIRITKGHTSLERLGSLGLDNWTSIGKTWSWFDHEAYRLVVLCQPHLLCMIVIRGVAGCWEAEWNPERQKCGRNTTPTDAIYHCS